MPSPMTVVVISKYSEVSGVAAALIRKEYKGSHVPWIFSASTNTSLKRYMDYDVINDFEIKIDIAIRHYLLDAKQIDFWLALDDESAESARIHVNRYRPLPNRFYHGPDTDTVLDCGFITPMIPSDKAYLVSWLRKLDNNLKPWSKKFWDDFCQSS